MTAFPPADEIPVTIRAENPADIPDIRKVNLEAFEGTGEANLVDRLRSRPAFTFSFVATRAGKITGHVLFSPVTVDANHTAKGLGLGPVAVLPQFQRKGIGSRLIRHGIVASRNAGYDFIVLLGHPDYYPRFGFVPASKYGIRCECDAPVEAFMILELRPGSLPGRPGTAIYQPEFNQV